MIMSRSSFVNWCKVVIQQLRGRVPCFQSELERLSIGSLSGYDSAKHKQIIFKCIIRHNFSYAIGNLDEQSIAAIIVKIHQIIDRVRSSGSSQKELGQHK